MAQQAATPGRADLEVHASDGTELYAEAHGTGSPVVFSCAFATTHENWRLQVEPLVAAGHRVVLWDYRGHGRSGAPEAAAAYSMEQVVDDLGKVLEAAAPGEPAVLAGLSFGGLASLHFTLAHPARVRGLVLIGSGPGFKNPEAQARWEAQTERTASFLETRGFAAFVERASDTTVGRRKLPAASRAASAIAAQDGAAVARFGRRVTGPAPGVIDRLAEIRCPALVVVGEEDKPFRRAAEVMASKLGDARYEVLAGAGHIVNVEAYEPFNALLLGFLDGLKG